MNISFQKFIVWRYETLSPTQRVLTEPYEFKINNETYVITKGFWTDSASIPRVAWSIIGSPFSGKYVCGALVHDVLYNAQPIDIERDDADNIFYQIMLESGVGHLKAWLMYHAVRMFGNSIWENKTMKQLEGASKHLIVGGR
jgi:hypothetical protein